MDRSYQNRRFDSKPIQDLDSGRAHVAGLRDDLRSRLDGTLARVVETSVERMSASIAP